MSFLSLTMFNNIDLSLAATLTMIGLGTAFIVLISLMAFILIIRKCVSSLINDKSDEQEPTNDKALAAAIGLSLVLHEGNIEDGVD
tara:strand:- start:943 stop:1200 length:258 start_codon:yes stop_codon:yes gene_type:complete